MWYIKGARKRYKTRCVPIERALSGPGLEAIYCFLQSKDPNDKTVTMKSEEIVTKGLKKEDPIAVEALDIFAKIYGAEAGNFSARTLCYGGIYLVGSLTTKIKEYLATFQEFFVY